MASTYSSYGYLSTDSPTRCTDVFYVFNVCPAEEWNINIHILNSWRWYDIFRILESSLLKKKLMLCHPLVRRIQEKFSQKQRENRKRRAYLQALYEI